MPLSGHRIKLRMKLFRPFILLAVTAIINSCSGAGYIQLSGYAQGGVYSIKCNAAGCRLKPGAMQAQADALLHSIDTTLSGYNRSSVLSRLNSGESVVLPEMFARIYELSYRYWELSEGAFDVSCGPVYDAWGFGFKTDSLPTHERVDSLMKACGMHRLISPEQMYSLIGRSICSRDFLRDGTGPAPVLNFNAIAQGFSCDLVAQWLHSLGVHDMLVDIGEIYCEGLNPSGKGWTIGIDNPEDGNQTPGASLRDTWQSDGGSCGVVTSGNYRKFYISDGRKYAHTIDPRTGYPVQHNLLSATVIAPDAAEADALATFFMVIGTDAAAQWVEGHNGISACLITSEDILWVE